MGTVPDWYPLMQAAKYLNVAPWALLEASAWWKDKALIAMSAEADAQEIRAQHNK
jgi:predicted chitinase